MRTKIIAAALQRDAGGADHRQVSEQPTGAMNDVNDVNDVNAGTLIHWPGSSKDHGDFDPADSLNGRNAPLETDK